MRKWQKGLLWGIGGLVLVLVVAVITLHLLTDDARLKAIAQNKVQQTMGRQLNLQSVGWQLFPYPRLTASGVAISNPAWAQDRHFLEADKVAAHLALMPLLTGKVVIKRLYFDGLRVNLETATDGRRTWDLPHVAHDDMTAQRLPDTLKQVALTALRIQNGLVNFRDHESRPIVWQVPKFQADGDSGLRDIDFELHITRDDHPLVLKGHVDDLSQLGASGAQSNGSIDAHSGEASLSIKGSLPLDPELKNYDIHASLDAASLKEAFGFFAVERGLPAALKAGAALRGSDKKIEVKDFKLQLGKLNATGEGILDHSGPKPSFDARIQADHVDMVQTFLDAGRPPLPPKVPGALFRDNPLQWPLLMALDGYEGKLDARVTSLKLRSGIEVRDATGKFFFNDDRMTVKPFFGKLVGGTASGDAVFDGKHKAVQLNLQLEGTQLGQWFKEAGKDIHMTGGAMRVSASLSTAGDSMRDLAAAITGPIHIRIGPAKILSQKAGHAEYWLTGLFSAKDADQIDLACVGARLPFQSGIAKGEGIAGARSDASQLLTGGTIDMRNETVDLRGRVRARSGVSLGLSTLAGNVKIVGKVAKPQLNLDESGVGGAIARIGAAIVTSGISIIATSIWDGANPESDPCQVVFSRKVEAAQGASKH